MVVARSPVEAKVQPPGAPSLRLNSTLQARMQALNYECEEYTDHLAIQHWHDLYNNLNGQLHTPSAWNLFRSLLGQAIPRHTLQKLLLAQQMEPSTLIEDNRNTFYLPFLTPQTQRSIHFRRT